jgi:excinuclease ABC subunit B
MTGSLDRALKETARRRDIQLAHNLKHGITPKTIERKIGDIRAMLGDTGVDEAKIRKVLDIEISASPQEIRAMIQQKKEEMVKAAANLLFETAGLLRDEIAVLESELQSHVPKRKSRRPT